MRRTIIGVPVCRWRPVRAASFRGIHHRTAKQPGRATDGRAGCRVPECRRTNSSAKTGTQHPATQNVLFSWAHPGTAGQEEYQCR